MGRLNKVFMRENIMIYKQDLIIDSFETKMINGLLKHGGMSEKEYPITHTAKFPNGYEADIKCCGADEDPAWTEGVLFNEKGGQASYTDPEDRYLGEWYFVDGDDNEYFVNVIEGK